MRFLKMPKYLHTRFVAETNLAAGKLVRVMEKGEEILELRRRARIPVEFKNV
jgi:hypothetical protein